MSGYRFDPQAFLLSSHDMDGVEIAALDTLQYGLAGDLGLFDPKRQQDAPVEVDLDEMRETVLRALDRLADAQAAEGGGLLAGPTTIEGVSTSVDTLGPEGAAPAAG